MLLFTIVEKYYQPRSQRAARPEAHSVTVSTDCLSHARNPLHLSSGPRAPSSPALPT